MPGKQNFSLEVLKNFENLRLNFFAANLHAFLISCIELSTNPLMNFTWTGLSKDSTVG